MRVLDSGREQLVFVADGDGTFTPRRVQIGARRQDVVEIASGLKEGDQVASSAAFFLDSESQLRAGVGGYEAPPSSRARVDRRATGHHAAYAGRSAENRREHVRGLGEGRVRPSHRGRGGGHSVLHARDADDEHAGDAQQRARSRPVAADSIAAPAKS